MMLEDRSVRNDEYPLERETMCYKIGILLFLGMLVSALLTGCTITLKGEGEFGFRQSTEWAFYHEVNQDESEGTSTSNIDSPPFIEWLLTPAEEPQAASTDSGVD